MIISKNEVKSMKEYIKKNPINGAWLIEEFMFRDIPERVGQFRFDGKDWVFPLEINVINGECYPGTSLLVTYPWLLFGYLNEQDVKKVSDKYSKELPDGTVFACAKVPGSLYQNVFIVDKYCSPEDMRGMLSVIIKINNDLLENHLKSLH